MMIQRMPPFLAGIMSGMMMHDAGSIWSPQFWLTPIIAGIFICLIDDKLAEIDRKQKAKAKWLAEEWGEVQKACIQCKGKTVVEVGQTVDNTGKKQRMMSTCPSCAGTGWEEAI